MSTEETIAAHWGVHVSGVSVTVNSENGGWVSRAKVRRSNGATERFSSTNMVKETALVRLIDQSEFRSRNPAPRRVVDWP